MALMAPGLTHAGDYGSLALATMFGYGGAWQNRPMVVNNFTPPYFALHPPVYYGQRFYRPYGDSPYASWPQLQPNPAYTPRPQAANGMAVGTVIDNPYCPPFGHANQSGHFDSTVVPQPQLAPHLGQPVEPIGPPAVLPSLDQPAGPQNQPAAPQGSPGKTPDVVNRPTGPLTIDNPYVKQFAQYVTRQAFRN